MKNTSGIIRREARPWLTQYLWDAIQYLQSQKQTFDTEILCKTTARRHPDFNECMARSELACALRDGLIKTSPNPGSKGNKNSLEKDMYHLPTSEKVEKDSHDWYCFSCHYPGKIIKCQSCYRVYHPDCIEENLKKNLNHLKENTPKEPKKDILKSEKNNKEETNKKAAESLNDSVINVSSSSEKELQIVLEDYKKNDEKEDPEKTILSKTKEEENNLNRIEEEIDTQDMLNIPYFKCDLCLVKETGNTRYKLRRSILNELLLHTCTRLKERMPVVVTERHFVQYVSAAAAAAAAASANGLVPQQPALPEPPSNNEVPIPANVVVNDQESPWRWAFIVYRTMDILTMELKAKQNRYRYMEEFEADAKLVFHILSVYHGPDSPVTKLAGQMIEDCIYDLDEIEACRYCYKMSNEKPDDIWFCRPCKPPHELVYAQQTRFPYWPAKVIKREVSGRYDVRFFGGKHERALIDAKNIKPITTSPTKLNIKRTVSWTKAMQELCKHQQMLSASPKEDLRPSDYEEEPEPEADLNQETFPESPPLPPPSYQTQTQGNNSVILALPSFYRRNSIQGEQTRRRGRTSQPETELKKNTQKSNLPSVKPTTPTTGDLNGAPTLTLQPKVQLKSDSIIQPPRKRGYHLGKRKLINSPSSSSGISSASSSPSASEQRLIREMEQERLARKAVEERLARVEDELARIHETYRAAISETKRKLWCSQCEAEAIYHCCWSTAYCSTDCQQKHWQRKHKGECCRKR